MKAILSDMVWMRQSDVDMQSVADAYKWRAFDERACAGCEYRMERFSEYPCGGCPAYKGHFKTYKEATFKGIPVVGLPRGELHNIAQFTGEIPEIEDIRCFKEMSEELCSRWEWKRTLFPEQQRIVNSYLQGNFLHDNINIREPYGIIVSPPRTGKTTILLHIAYLLKLKTLVIANQDDLLLNFKKDLEDSTNILDIEATDNRIYHGIAKTTDEILNLDIAFTTWQGFNTSSGKLTTRDLRGKIGLLIVDESHRSASPVYGDVVASFDAAFRIGTTATAKRKDGLHKRMNHILGPVTVTGHIDTLTPKWSLHYTNFSYQRKQVNWVTFISNMFKNEKRTQLIMNYLRRDLDNGRYIVIPVSRRAVCMDWVKRINKMGYSAEAFVAGSDRDAIVERARRGKTRVVVGIRSILSTGVNVPKWDCLYEVEPISNDPNFYQEYSRICTTLEGKPQPVIRMFVDDAGPSYGCFRTCYKRLKDLPPMNKITEERARDILQGRKLAKKTFSPERSIPNMWR